MTQRLKCSQSGPDSLNMEPRMAPQGLAGWARVGAPVRGVAAEALATTVRRRHRARVRPRSGRGAVAVVEARSQRMELWDVGRGGEYVRDNGCRRALANGPWACGEARLRTGSALGWTHGYATWAPAAS